MEEIGFVFNKVNEMANFVNEKAGKNIDSEELYLMAILQINNYEISAIELDIDELYADMETLFFENSPVLFSENTKETLDFLKKNQNNTLNILSNTAFAKGKSLRIILEKLAIADYFDFQLYSDEVRLSKPNPAFFDLMIQNARLLQPDIALHQILHIGDNALADIEGAKRAGIGAFLLNTNEKMIADLQKFISN